MPEGISPWPEVKSGANAHPIKTLQYLLRAYGEGVVVDGQFGPETEVAVKVFQSRRGLAADGIVGPVTWSALVVEVKTGEPGGGQTGEPGGGGQRRAGGVPVP
jgi:N-acetyl-anhydromuramyl-L-alanine amidase AmpD